LKVGGGRRIIEKNRGRKGVKKSRERNVEYSVVHHKVTTAFIIFRMCIKGGV
jgi:hypothetical protein